MKCNQVGCKEEAKYTYIWPGKGEAGICEEHKLCAERASSALGFGIKFEPIVPFGKNIFLILTNLNSGIITYYVYNSEAELEYVKLHMKNFLDNHGTWAYKDIMGVISELEAMGFREIKFDKALELGNCVVMRIAFCDIK
jgi:hypothetical protein